MIKFFKKIRQNLLMENKTGKYFKYAIGEIILVVIGILIALQINNWNDYRKERNEEKIILVALLQEFKNSKVSLIETIERNNQRFNSLKELLNHTGSHWDNTLTRQKSDYLMRPFVAVTTADISTSTLDQLLNTGRIQIIQNDSLQQLLANWNKELKDHKLETEDLLLKFRRDQIIPFMIKHYTYNMGGSRMASYNLKPSGFDFDYKAIYQIPEFENMLFNRIARIDWANREYNILIDQCDTFISIIQSEINK
jgi:hypothetical protein